MHYKLYEKYIKVHEIRQRSEYKLFIKGTKKCIKYLSSGFDLNFWNFHDYNQLWFYAMDCPKKILIYAGQGNMTTNDLIIKAFNWKNSKDILHAWIPWNIILILILRYPHGNCFSVAGEKSKCDPNSNVNIDIVFWKYCDDLKQCTLIFRHLNR